MAETLPINFEVPGELKIASYDYTDLADGTGISKFYLMALKTSSATTYRLSTQVIHSNDGLMETTASVGVGSALTKIIDIDFDLSTFNIPRSLLGNCVLCLGYDVAKTGTGGNGYFIARLRKYSGVTETEITSAQTETFGTDVISSGVFTLPLPITTIVNFKKGDILRLTIEGWADSGQGVGLTIGHDPLDRDGTVITPSTVPDELTASYCLISFKIEL